MDKKEEEIVKKKLGKEDNEELKKEVLNGTKELKEELEKSEKLAEERLNQLKYLQADFDNYRKKFEKEKQDITKLANESLIRELLVILDDLDSSMKLLIDDKNKQGLFLH